MTRPIALARTLAWTSLIAVVAFVGTVGAFEDWPRWMGPRMDGEWRESGLIEEFPEGELAFTWSQPIGPGYSGPAVVGNRLFVMDRTKDDGKGKQVENGIRQAGVIPGGERILCLDTKTGDTLWEHTYDCPYNIAYPTGPRCTPAVDGDRVYTLGAMGHLKCLDINDGHVIWEVSLMDQYETKPPAWGYASHPLVDGPRLLVPCGGKGSAIVCLDKMTGEEIWKNLTSEDIGYAPVVFYEPDDGPRQLIFWHGDGVDSLNSETGEHYWHVKWPEEKAQPQATTIATPRIVGNQVLFSEYYKGSLLLELESNPPAANEIYRTFKTDPRGKTSQTALMTTPVIRDGMIYGIAGLGEFRCNRWDNHELVWEKKDWLAEEPIVFATAFLVKNGERYFMFNDIGELMIVRLSPDGFDEVGRRKVLEPTGVARGRKVVWSHPAFSNGHMFARNDSEIVCVDLRKPDAALAPSSDQNSNGE